MVPIIPALLFNILYELAKLFDIRTLIFDKRFNQILKYSVTLPKGNYISN